MARTLTELRDRCPEGLRRRAAAESYIKQGPDNYTSKMLNWAADEIEKLASKLKALDPNFIDYHRQKFLDQKAVASV